MNTTKLGVWLEIQYELVWTVFHYNTVFKCISLNVTGLNILSDVKGETFAQEEPNFGEARDG